MTALSPARAQGYLESKASGRVVASRFATTHPVRFCTRRCWPFSGDDGGAPRQSLPCFPTANRAHVATEIRGDFFPGIQAFLSHVIGEHRPVRGLCVPDSQRRSQRLKTFAGQAILAACCCLFNSIPDRALQDIRPCPPLSLASISCSSYLPRTVDSVTHSLTVRESRFC